VKLVSALFVALAAATIALPGAAQPVPQKLEIETGSGPHHFDIELVRLRADMERGLMFRKSMPESHGMLFDFRTAQPIAMWMKNTYIPLDMVFIGTDGHVTHVAENAVPMSEDIISSDGPAVGVLELNAGVAAKIGVKPGDVVHASIFPK
jgi:uncharacterized membrane protein (UPF0127 family)